MTEKIYTITLNDLDISDLMLTRNWHKDSTVPIWERSRLKDDFHQFEVVAKAIDTNYECAENKRKKTCHICNIDVPTAFMKEHKNSYKHRTCLKISELALDRVKKQVIHDTDVIPPPDCPDNDSVYFCEPCAVAVNVINKKQHENSEEHAVSVKHDTLLNDLLLLYNDKCNINILENSSIDIKNINVETKSTNTCINHTFRNNVRNDNLTAKIEEVDIKDENINKSKGVTNTSAKSDIPNTAESKNTAKDQVPLNANESKEIPIPTSSNWFRQLLHDNKIKLVENGILYCETCDVFLIKPTVAEHVRKESHRDKLSNQTNRVVSEVNVNKNSKVFVNKTEPQVKNTVNLSETYHYCVICKVNVPHYPANIKDHNKGKNHQKKLMAQKDVINVPEDSNPEMASCEPKENAAYSHTITERTFDMNTEEIQKENPNNDKLLQGLQVTDTVSNLGKETRTYLNAGSTVDTRSQDANKLDEKMTVHYLLQYNESADEMKCKVCDVTFKYEPGCSKKHRSTLDHKTKHSTMRFENELKLDYITNKLRCNVCKVDLNKEEDITHIATDAHKNNLWKAKFIRTKQNEIYKSNDDVWKSEITFGFWDEIVTPIPDKLIMNNTIEVKPSTSELGEVERGKNIMDEVIEMRRNLNEAFCKLCRVVVPIRPDLIKEHVDGKKHKAQSLLTINSFEDNGNFFCYHCNTVIEEGDVILHVIGNDHIERVREK